jgi:hypothetical protein
MRLGRSIEKRHGVDEPGYEPPVDKPVEPPEPEPPRPPKKWHQKARWRILIGFFVFTLAAGWNAGTFDHVLVNVGLNAKPCARNGFGAVFCGKELEERRAQQQQSESEAAKLKQQGEEASAKMPYSPIVQNLSAPAAMVRPGAGQT